MKNFALVLAATALFALPAAVQAAPCKDAKGHFTKCPPAAAMPMAAAKAAPAKMAPAAVAAKPMVSRKATATPAKMAAKGPRKAPCRDAKGRFMKCK